MTALSRRTARSAAAAPGATAPRRRSLEELLTRQEPFSLHTGLHIGVLDVDGYYIDFRGKSESPAWPPPWFPWPGFHRFMGIAQWGLGCHERYVATEGERWLRGALAAGEHLVRHQDQDGTWPEPRDQRHTFDIAGPWVSAMAQGQCASLLVRLGLRTGDERFAEAARCALPSTYDSVAAGGTRAYLQGRPFPEEYPTDPPSFVLNGGIFALWGYYDVWRGVGDERAGAEWVAGAKALACHLHRWDTGFWSRYDLYPHRLLNVASAFYHALHINQLQALAMIAPHEAFSETLERFEAYAAQPVNRMRALLHKLAFRAAVSRGHKAGHAGG